MPTVAAYNLITSTDQEVIYDVQGATDLQIDISTAAVYLRFAYRFSNVTGGLGLPELHIPKLLTLTDEAIDQVSVKSAAVGVPATLTIIGSN